ncbi:ATP-binding protein [Synechocystis sp. B12]|nr:ATP-binding protein [Synechocystis sp. B12]
MADPDRTEQILVNLIGNAVRYTPSGAITIDAYLCTDRKDMEKENLLWVTVTDTGIGIAEGIYPTCLSDFGGLINPVPVIPVARAGAGDRQTVGGIAGGSLTVTSTLGQGSEFSFSLPLV